MIANADALPAAPLIVDRDGQRHLDRHTLAALTGRSVHTIRARCPIAFHHQGKAMYDMNLCEDLLRKVSTRQRALAA